MSCGTNGIGSAALQQQAGVSMLGKALDTQKSQVAQVLQSAPKPAVQDPALGNVVNFTA